jgi:hypothetical protein
LAANRGARVIVGLGTNSLCATPTKGELANARMKRKLICPHHDSEHPFDMTGYSKMAKLIQKQGSTCDWIGPPRLNPGESKGFPSGRVAAEEQNLDDFYDLDAPV